MPDSQTTLDPENWPAVRRKAHGMLDDILDFVQGLRDRPVWRPIPDAVRRRFRQALPASPSSLEEVHQEVVDHILPYGVGNGHPRFFGWVHGGGNVAGMLAEMLAAGLNANLGGRDQIPVEVERQVVRWMAELFGFPETAGGLFVTGASMANMVGVLMARTAALGPAVRREGLAGGGAQLAAYASDQAHNCLPRAMDMCGIGSDFLRLTPADADGRVDVAALKAAIAADRAAGLTPFLVVGAAGSVNTGAIDDLDALADLARAEGLWFHVDGALGALGMLAPELKARLAGIGRADSIAFDFHKWGQAPYDAGFILVRDQAAQLATFSAPAAYLGRAARGLAAGSPWPCDLGPDLSRGFRALKVWFALKHYGADALGAAIWNTCRLAAYLAARVDAEPELERLAPVALNIVCFRHRGPDPDALNAALVVALQESGLAAPSVTEVGGATAIRVAIVNHRTTAEDLDLLLTETLRLGRLGVAGFAGEDA